MFFSRFQFALVAGFADSPFSRGPAVRNPVPSALNEALQVFPIEVHDQIKIGSQSHHAVQAQHLLPRCTWTLLSCSFLKTSS